MVIPTMESELRMTLMQLSETRLELAAVTEQRDRLKEELKETKKHLKDANRGAEINAHALRINADKLISVTEQRDEMAEFCDWMTPKQATPEEGEWVLHTYAGVRVPEYGMYARGVFLRNNSPESFPTTHWMRIPSIDEPNNQPTEL